ncbi:MAG: glucose-6-phosphate isomerase [Clostridia bacterium]|nr:glucose-6-phosphate isomerase [Clostridia bacterium]
MAYETPEIFDFDLDSGFCLQKEPMHRHLSAMNGMFHDEAAYQAAMKDNPRIYSFYDMDVPARSTDLAYGTSICYPGKVGDEFFMTKGHYHEIMDTAEVYYCQQGRGLMMMETLDGRWDCKELVPGRVVYVPGGWAHRSINIGDVPFVTFFVFRADAGHDYATIEHNSFRKCVVADQGGYAVIDNPNWQGGELAK